MMFQGFIAADCKWQYLVIEGGKRLEKKRDWSQKFLVSHADNFGWGNCGR